MTAFERNKHSSLALVASLAMAVTACSDGSASSIIEGSTLQPSSSETNDRGGSSGSANGGSPGASRGGAANGGGNAIGRGGSGTTSSGGSGLSGGLDSDPGGEPGGVGGGEPGGEPGSDSGGTSPPASPTPTPGGGFFGGGPGFGNGGTSSGNPGSGTPDPGATPPSGNDGPDPNGPSPLHGERYPFPQNVTYPHGNHSSNISADHVRSWYESWRDKYLQECNGNLRPGVDPLSQSLVEAQGFAMVAAAYMGDKPTLDRLYEYYRAKLTNSACGLMAWDQTCQGFNDQGAATDGDIDVASGLVVAHWQWPNDGYDDKARGVISNLKRMIVNCGGTSALYPGCAGGSPWGGCNETDASYYSPGFFRYFAQISGDEAWNKLADDSHVIRDAAAHPTTGLVPDWQSVSGTPGAGSRKGYYSFDAIRTPYKHALDYLWHGNERARAWCEKISSWAYNQVGVENIVDGYQLDGRQAGQYHNLAAVGSLAVCAMANTQDITDAFIAESVKMRDDFWYSAYLGNLYLLAMSGNMWTPDIVGR